MLDICHIEQDDSVPQGQTGKQARQKDKYGDEACKDDEASALWLLLPLGKPVRRGAELGGGLGYAKRVEDAGDMAARNG